MKTVKYIILIFGLGIISDISVADSWSEIFIGWDNREYYSSTANPKIGLALSGGGARGLAQIGVLKAFEESGIEVHAIAGTSIGGIIGGLYSSGFSAEELERIIKTIDFPALFSNRPRRTSMFLTQRPEKERSLISVRFDGFMPYIPQAITTGQKLSNLLIDLTLKANYISGCDFSRLKIPFRAITTDIVTGDKVVISSGNLSDAMRSTMAFPLAFTGVESDGKILMDGGMVDPIPVDILYEIDSTLPLMVAINTASELLPKEEINNPIDIANQVTSIMTMDKLKAGLELADIAISPHLTNYNSIAFDKADELIELGYQAGKKAVPEILALLNNNHNDSLMIAEISFAKTPQNFNINQFPLKQGQIISHKDLKRIAANLYEKNSLFSLRINIIMEKKPYTSGQSGKLVIEMIPQPSINELSFVISGNTVHDDSSICQLLLNEDELLSSERLVDFPDCLEDIYKEKGYDLTHLRSLKYEPEQNAVYIDIDEAIVETINIDGNQKTKNWLIKSNFPLKENAPFNSQKASRGIANIYATDLFDRVTLNIAPGEKGAVVNINVKEKKYTQLRLGWHWDDEYKSEQFVEILNDNLLGTGQELLTHAQYAKRRQKYEISLKADRFFSTWLTYRVAGFYNILERNIYDTEGYSDSTIRENRIGIEFLLGQQIARFGTVTGKISWEEIQNKHFPGGYIDKIKLRSITFRSLVETINKYPFPTAGKKHLFYIKFATDILGGETKYSKVYSSIESYFPLGRNLNFHPRISIGYININTKFGVPFSERFHIGGHYSLSGFNTGELVGAKMILGNMEMRMKLPFNFYLYGRYDLGDVYSTVGQIKLKNLHHGYGFSLAYDSPIGPIDFGYGKSGNHPDRFYINVGLKF